MILDATGNWEYVVFATVVAITLIALTWFLRRQGVSLYSLSALWAVISAVLVGGWFFVLEREDRVYRFKSSFATRMAKACATQLELMGHSRITSQPGAEADPTYKSIRDMLFRWQKSAENSYAFYTMRMEAGEVFFVVNPPFDSNRDGSIDPLREYGGPIGEVYKQVDPAMLAAFQGTPGFHDQPVQDEWGVWVSAYEPVFDEKGQVEAILGVDIDAREWMARGREARLFALFKVASTTLLVLSAGAIIALMAQTLRVRAEHSATLQDQAVLAHNHAVEVQLLADRLEERNHELEALHAELGIQNQNLQASEQQLKIALLKAEMTEEMHRNAAKRLEDLFYGLPVACFTCDLDGLVYEWNSRAVDLFGRTADETMLKHVSECIGPFDNPDRFAMLFEQARQGERLHNIEWHRRTPGGQDQWILTSAFPLTNETGEIVASVITSLDITERVRFERDLLSQTLQNQEQLERINRMYREIQAQKTQLRKANQTLAGLATTDGLTGLRNHRSFQQALEKAERRAKVSGQPLSIVFCDVDQFKLYNDEFGHPEGDKVLKTVAQSLSGFSRQKDCIARYGGEEFAVILPNTTRAQAMAIAERFREAIESTCWELRPITASFGVSTLLESESAHQTVARADEALYESKRQGRNRVTHWDELPGRAA